jgi:hypothetical protein
MYHVSLVFLLRDKYLEAEMMCRRALDGMQKTLGSGEHLDVSSCDRDYEGILEKLGPEDLKGEKRIEKMGFVNLGEGEIEDQERSSD